MTFDFCFAVYNSRKWLEGCVQAISKLDYDTKQLALYFADGASQDDSLALLARLKAEYGHLFAAFEIIPTGQNRGFGAASNRAAAVGCGDYVFFFNLDTQILPNALTELEAAIRACDESWAAFELRQFPYEHNKYYDPVTLEVSWASGAAFVVRRDALRQVGGFDESIFMYSEDVELSWRIRLHGYKIRYVPSAVTWHFTYQSPGETKPIQTLDVASNMVLRYKYGTAADIAEGRRLLRDAVADLERRSVDTTLLHAQLARIRAARRQYRAFYNQTVRHSSFTPQFQGFGYEFGRSGPFYQSHFPAAQPAITVIVRTFQRPQVLALTLESLRHQTYKNFKVIVVEDGTAPVSQQVVQNASAWLDIAYLPLRRQAGRCRAGNAGLRAVTTEYACFLDDDDYFFADHMEVMACLIEANRNCGLFIAGAVEGTCKNSSGADYRFISMRNKAYASLRPVNFFADNPIPIQAAVFRTSLALAAGGLDESLDALEDWDLWMRLICHTGFAFTDKATSIYKIPDHDSGFAKRDAFIAGYRKTVFEKMAHYGRYIPAQDILRLFWEPPQQQAQTLEQHEAGLRRTAAEIRSSASWRISAPLRVLPRLLMRFAQLVQRLVLFLADLVNRLLRLLCAPFIWFATVTRRFGDWVGPEDIDPATAPLDAVHSFVLLSRRSLGWKFARFLSRLRR